MAYGYQATVPGANVRGCSDVLQFVCGCLSV